MTGAIVPRPIAWVSTISETGRRNLAPFSFFNGVAVMPPTLMFSTADRDGRIPHKDTYANLLATRECVVNIVAESNADAMNLTSTELPSDVDEWELTGLTPVPSSRVKPPRIGESPVHFECTLNQVITLENELGCSHLMLCNILTIHVEDNLYLGDHKIDPEALKAVGRLGGPNYIYTNDLFQMTRPPSQIDES
jgi:flavin reductase (DIM6/NTAB) family NADH-FMN oxidoreductase RutF